MRPKEEPEQHRPEILMATVYLKSKTGRSLLQERKPMLADPAPYLPSSETIQKAITELQQRGFTIEAQGVTLSISGPPELFEAVCSVKVSFDETKVQEPGQIRPQTRLVYRSSQLVMKIHGLEDIIEGIIFAIPGVPFESRESEK
jgi:hypothetical protein